MRKLINLFIAILLVFLYSCEKKDDNKYLFGPNFQTIILERSPQMGFCIDENEIITGTLSVKSSGTYFHGTKAVTSNSSEDNCFENNQSHPCTIESAFSSIEITQDQLKEIKKLVVQIPKWECEYNGACDPCLLIRITVDNKQIRGTTCCNNVDENYQKAFIALVEYLDNLVK